MIYFDNNWQVALRSTGWRISGSGKFAWNIILCFCEHSTLNLNWWLHNTRENCKFIIGLKCSFFVLFESSLNHSIDYLSLYSLDFNWSATSILSYNSLGKHAIMETETQFEFPMETLTQIQLIRLYWCRGEFTWQFSTAL